MRWPLLAATVVCEVVGTLSLKAAQTHPAWFVLVVAGYLAAFIGLSAVLRGGMPVGMAYGFWAAAGVLLTALASAVIFDEGLTPTMVAGIGLIVVGVLAVHLGAPEARESEAP